MFCVGSSPLPSTGARTSAADVVAVAEALNVPAAGFDLGTYWLEVLACSRRALTLSPFLACDLQRASGTSSDEGSSLRFSPQLRRDYVEYYVALITDVSDIKSVRFATSSVVMRADVFSTFASVLLVPSFGPDTGYNPLLTSSHVSLVERVELSLASPRYTWLPTAALRGPTGGTDTPWGALRRESPQCCYRPLNGSPGNSPTASKQKEQLRPDPPNSIVSRKMNNAYKWQLPPEIFNKRKMAYKKSHRLAVTSVQKKKYDGSSISKHSETRNALKFNSLANNAT
ncbi:hypothetical protein ACJJTC_013881 [Scirpophaga incertulas]